MVNLIKAAPPTRKLASAGFKNSDLPKIDLIKHKQEDKKNDSVNVSK